MKKLKQRLVDTKAKGTRIIRLRASGVRSATWAKTGGKPGMCYGQDITGIADTTLKAQRRAINKAASAPCAEKNLVASLWLHDCSSGKLDPTYDAHELPLLNYAKAW